MDRTFKGKAKRLDDIDLPKLGARLGVGEDEIHAFIDVETRGSGFDSFGRPVILFEPHIFYKYLKGAQREKAVAQGLAYPKQGTRPYPRESYTRLNAALKINVTAALYAASWGLGQMMGFNHVLAGYDDVEAMVAAFMDDEETHLEASVNFILKTKLDDELRRHDWAGFAKGYNGAGYRKNRYDEKLADAYAKWKRIKDTPWTPNETMNKPFVSQPPPIVADKPVSVPPVPVSAPEPIVGIRGLIADIFKAIAAFFKRK